MSKKLKKLLPQAALLALLGALAISFGAASSEPAFELTVRARQMAFYVGDDPRPNPPIALPTDRRVRITFVNEDRGVQHDLAIPDLDVRTDLLAGDGSSQVLRFHTPSTGISASYLCSLHPTMMAAAVEIR